MMRKTYYQNYAFFAIVLLLLFTYKKYTAKKPENFPEVRFISEKSSSIPLVEFNPNELDAKEWENLGFTKKQVATILKYKEIVGGSFSSKDEIQKCYAISAEKYEEIKPYLLLPESTSIDYKNFVSKEKNNLNIKGRFNPDHLTLKEWEELGFSTKQSSAILKYKSYLGGSFISKEKFKECFIINEENYKKLSAYLILPDKSPTPIHSNLASTGKVINYTKFDPNILDIDGWKKLGFSDKQAMVIVNYRNQNLKGSFKTLDDLKNCFVISPDKFEQLKPYVLLNSTTTSLNNEVKSAPIQEKTDFSKVNLNEITFKQLLEFGLDEKAAGSMIGFRKKLGGFVNKEQILDTYNIDKELVKKLLSTSYLDASKVQKYTLVDAPEEWLKNHPYFKYSADKIIYYRTSYPEEKKIWQNLKVKPEYEAKMRLYLK